MIQPGRRFAMTMLVAASVINACGGGDDSASPPASEPAEPSADSAGTASSSSSSTTTTTTEATATTTMSTSTTTTPASTSTTTMIPDEPGPDQEALDGIGLVLELVAMAEAPIDMAVHPVTGRIVLAERAGRILEFDDDTVGDVLIDIRDNVTIEGEGGLLSITYDPGGDHLYVSFTNAEGDSRVVAYETDNGAPDPDRVHTILELDQPELIHNGGHVRFGPDGYLYISLGDGGPADDPEDRGQRLDTLLGKILRIEPTPGESQPYMVPADNPFVDVEGARPENWAYGLRNPWRFAFDPANDDIWIGDVGQFVVEEINWVSGDTGARAANFGWARFEGPIERGPEPDDHVEPVHFYNHDGGRCSVIAGPVYRGSALPDLVGAHIYSDFCDGMIRALTLVDGEVVAQRSFDPLFGLVTSFAEGPDREIYAFHLAGEIRRIAPA